MTITLMDSFNLVIDENSHFLDDDACRKISTRVHADEGCDLKLSSYPKTRFYGSKRRQLNWLFPHLRRLSGTTVLDAFGGTGSVSLLFSQLGKLVTYNDVFRFQEISAKALLGDLGGLVLAPERLASFLATVTPRNGLVTQCFQGLYFTQAENGWLDGVMERISCVASIPEKSVLLYCLFQACLSKRPYNLFHRANLNIRQSKEHVSFGNRTTWEKSFGEHMMSAYRELIRGRKLLKHPINVMPCGSVEDLDIGFDIVYMDPPYFNSHRYTESYLLRYHFLEGLARFDEWESLIEHGSKIKKLSDNAVPAEWRSKHDFTPALFSLIDRFRSSTVVLSYVADAHPNENQIAEHFESRFKKCRVIRMDCRRTLSRRIRTELLFIGEP